MEIVIQVVAWTALVLNVSTMFLGVLGYAVTRTTSRTQIFLVTVPQAFAAIVALVVIFG